MTLSPVVRWFTLLLLALSMPVAAAQEQRVSFPQLDAGVRVRISAPEILRRPIIGQVAEVSAHSVTVSEGQSGEIVVPLAAVASVERSRGYRRGAGAGLGALVGAAAGVGLGFLCVYVCPDSPGGGANMAPVGGLFVGPPLGAALGALIAPERWEALPLVDAQRALP